MLKRAFALLTSTWFAVIVMVVLAVLSLAGSIIPQGAAADAYIKAYGGFFGRIVVGLALGNIFRTAYYIALLVLLCAMVFACALKGLPSQVRAASRPRAIPDAGRIAQMTASATLTLAVPEEEAHLHVVDILKRRFYSVQSAKGGTAASKMAFARYGTFVLHMSFVFLLAGGIVLAKLGTHGMREVAVGSDFPLEVSGGRNVSVAIEDFDIKFDARNNVSDFVCDIALREDGQVLERYTIRPNHPFKYGRNEIYLNSFAADEESPEGFVLSIYDSTGALVASDVALAADRPTYMEEIGATVIPGDGTRPHVDLTFNDGRRESHLMRMHLTRGSDGPSGYQFLLQESVPSIVVALEVVREPGQWLLIVGLVLLSVGVFMALYMSHRSVFAVVEPLEGGRSRVTIGGRASRNREGFAREFEAIRRTLEELA